MKEFRRYAVYYTPPQGPLRQFGAEWLGWDIHNGRSLRHPDLPGLTRDRIAALTETPRRYGFHATLKPPFRLAPGRSEAQLIDELRATTRSLGRVGLIGGLRLTALKDFIALVPAHPSTELQALAGRLVRQLDPYRAPLTPAEIHRRHPDRLTEAQRQNLSNWGYPFVMDEFRFHLTLTGRLPERQLTEVLDRLERLTRLTPLLMPVKPDQMIVDEVMLCGEDEHGRFHVIQRFELGSGG